MAPSCRDVNSAKNAGTLTSITDAAPSTFMSAVYD
jgi:hypothetical protein